MQVRRYEPEDYAQISQWALDGWDTDYTEDQFPKTGLIVDGIAALFLYSTDSSICFLENMISNKKSDPDLKEEALNLLMGSMLELANELGFKVAYATTRNSKVIVRAIKHGCKIEINQTLLTKNLNDPS
jgi:hypothetical protein